MPAPSQMAISLAAVQSLIAGRDDLHPQKRGEMRSAINTFAKVCNRSPSDIIADPATIRGLAERAPWKLFDLSKRSWANVLSRLTKAMELAGVAVHRRRRNFKLHPAWDDLLEPLSRRDRDEIHRFAGWCSVSGIAPEEVAPATFDRFLSYLEEQIIQSDPRERAHVARRVWNRAIAGIPGSTYPEIPAPEPNGRRLVAWSDVPEALRLEVDAYKTRVTSKALFDDDNRPIKEVTLVGYLTALRAYITALVESGVPLESLISLSALVEIDMVKRGLTQRLGQRSLEDERARMDLQAMVIALLSVATYLGVDDAHRKGLKRILKRVQYRPNGLCRKNKERLTPLLSPSAIQRLVRLPQTVAQGLRKVTAPTTRQAQRMQMACLLELLLNVPMRIKNVSQLDLATSILRPIGGKGPWRIYLPSEDVKNGVPIEATLGEETCALLDRYVDVFRPVLVKGEPTTALFVGQRGGAKGASSLSRQFSRFVLRECGLIVNPHLMRHLAAHLFLKDKPGCYETVRRLLGHKSIQTTINSYAGTETGDAFDLYDALLSTVRKEGRGGGLEAEDEQ